MTTQAHPQQRTVWALDPSHSSVDFSARHMVISTVRGHFAKVEVDATFNEQAPEKSSIAARIDVNSIDTKDAQRDAHLKSADFLDAAKYPTLVFASKRVQAAGNGRYSVVGDLTIHGVTRQVSLDTTFAGTVKDPWGNQRAGFSAETTINRKDFSLTWNQLLEAGGWAVGEAVKISIEAEFVKKG